jgi:hypothetical protein
MAELQAGERREVLSSMADRIGAKFLGGIPHRPVVEAIEETLKEEGIVLVNEWESYTPPAPTPRANGEPS